MSQKTISAILNVCGYVVIIIGVIFGLGIMIKMSEGGIFSSGNPGMGAALGILVAFYHFMFGMFCFGISKIIYSEKTEVDQTNLENEPNIIKCSKCGKTYPNDYQGEFCEECGTHL